MSRDYNFTDPDYPTAVAAAAYAIHSLKDNSAPDKIMSRRVSKAEEDNYAPEIMSRRKSKPEDNWPMNWIQPQSQRNGLDIPDGSYMNSYDYPRDIKEPSRMATSRRMSEKRDKSFNKMKSRAEDNVVLHEPHETSLSFSDETSDETFKTPALGSPIISPPTPERTVHRRPSSIKKKLSFSDSNESYNNKPDNSAPERTHSWRPPTPANKHFDITESQKPEVPRPRPAEMRWETTGKPGPAEAMAEAWEKEEMAGIKERYERLRAIIDEWEIKKRKSAKNKLEREEANPNKSRTKAMERYRKEIERIEEIAVGARAQSEANRRKEEFKVKEKANKIRVTGKIPATCLCF